MRTPSFQQVASRQRRSRPYVAFLLIGPLLFLVGSLYTVGSSYTVACVGVHYQVLTSSHELRYLLNVTPG